jgi:hypothetical protein
MPLSPKKAAASNSAPGPPDIPVIDGKYQAPTHPIGLWRTFPQDRIGVGSYAIAIGKTTAERKTISTCQLGVFAISRRTI